MTALPNLPIRSHVALRRRLDGLKSGNEQRQRAAENTLRQMELALARSVKNAKAAFIADCAASYRSHRERDFHTELLAHRMAIRILLHQQAQRVIPRFARDTQRGIVAGLKCRPIEAKREEGQFTRLIQQWLGQRQDMATTIAQTSLSDVLRAVEGGIAAGDGTDDIARAIESTAKLGPYRSMVVARTETHAAALFAQVESAREAEQTYDIKLMKEWLPTLDARTRDAHAAMAGYGPIPLDEKFVVGGEEMDRPGDPAGSAANVVACRCTLVMSHAPD